jgi:malonyl-CoA O-methyltransferase
MSALPAAEAYRRWAPTYEAENGLTTIECELVEQLSPSPRGLRLLDVGCGTGRRLVNTGAVCAVGVEPCTEMIAAGRRAWRFGPEVRFIEADAGALPLPDASFDLAWCRLMIGHVRDFRQVYSELGRVVARGGHAVVTDFHAAACAAGMRRTFRDGDDVLEVEHHVHTFADQVAAGASAGLRLLASLDGRIGPSVRRYYDSAGKAALYGEHVGTPVVLGLSFVRDG